MKKWMVTACALAMVLGAVATPAHAARMACKRGNADCGNQIIGRNFEDADNDGICDNKQSGGNDRNFADADNDGICDHRGGRTSGGRGRHCGKNR